MVTRQALSAIAAASVLSATPLIASIGWSAARNEAPQYFLSISATDSQAAQGIKEALLAGAADAVEQTGTKNGFFGDPAIKILMPQKLQPIESGLRAIGYGPQIDALVLSMNRAAEAAVPLARPIFEKAITNMTFTDAQQIVSGGGQSATDYFRQKTSGELMTAFTPVVRKTVEQYAVIKQYDDLINQYRTGPLAGLLGAAMPTLDINSYVAQKSLDGLFYMMGQNEEEIRSDPAARVTPLLRRVFGGLQPNAP
jgi:hypothetical protein